MSAHLPYLDSARHYKDKIVSPIAHILAKFVTADFLTSTSIIIVILGLILSFTLKHPGWFVYSLIIHFILDLFDGAVARIHNTRNSFKGALKDLGADTSIAAFTGFYLYLFTNTGALMSTLFSILILTSTILTVWQWRLGRTTKIWFRPRTAVYLSILIDYFAYTSFTPLIVNLGNLFMLYIIFKSIETIIRPRARNL